MMTDETIHSEDPSDTLADGAPDPAPGLAPPVPNPDNTSPLKGAGERSLSAAIAFLAKWFEQKATRPLDRVMETEFRNRRDLNSSERRWIGSVVFGCVRYLRRQEFLLEKLGLPNTPENLCRLWAMSPADDEPAVTFRFTLALVSQEQLAEALALLPTRDNPKEYLRITLAFPDEMATELEELLGAEAILAGESLNKQAPITLRVNTLKTTPSRLIPRLPPGLATPARYSPIGIQLATRVNITGLTGWKEGFFEAQEEASQLVSLLLDAKPGETVVDVGAGAGGKTLALGAAMQGKGRLIALDLPSLRFGQLQERVRRAGIRNLEMLTMNATEAGEWQPDDFAKRKLGGLIHKCDAVMVDSPCSGSGVLRRNPDTKWRVNDLAEFARLQLLLLSQSARLVKPGGRLLYVTCAFERIQNEDVVADFLKSEIGSGFAVEDIPAEFVPFASSEAPVIRTWAHRHQMDSFFALQMRRK